MKTIRHFFTLALSAALLFSGCNDDYDDKALWDEVNNQAARIAALRWSSGRLRSTVTFQPFRNLFPHCRTTTT